jgi:hypothetical protein
MGACLGVKQSTVYGLSLPFLVEVLGAGHEHDTLVYNPLANAEILIDC